MEVSNEYTRIIKKQIEKAAAQHDAQIAITRYRGTDCKVHQGGEAVHGTFAIASYSVSDKLYNQPELGPLTAALFYVYL